MKKFAIALAAFLSAFSVLAQSSYTPVTREAPGGQNVNGQIKVTANSITVTNGQAISLGAFPVIYVNSVGANAETNVITVAAASASLVGASYTIINVNSSNLLQITDSAPVYGTGAVLGQRDTVSFFVKATNEIIQTSTSNN